MTPSGGGSVGWRPARRLPLAALLRVAALVWISLAATGAQALVFAGPKTQFPGGLGGFAISGGFAYLCASGEFRIVDLAEIGAGFEPLGVLPGGCGSLEVRGTLAYLLGDGLRIVDVSDPEHPVELGALELGHPALDFDVVAGRAYVVTISPAAVPPDSGDLALVVVDISNPAAPAVLGELEIGQSFLVSELAIAAENDVVFLSRDLRVTSIDVTNPAAPSVIAPFDFVSGMLGTSLAVRDGILYATAEGEPGDGSPFGLPTVRLLDVRDPAAPVELSRFVASCRDMDLVGDALYCVDIYNLSVVDVSDPAEPLPLGDLFAKSGQGFLFDLAVGGGGALVATGPYYFAEPYTLQAVDVRVPEFPQRNPVPFGGTPEYTAFETAGPVLYAGTFGALEVFDIHDGTSPVPIGGIGIPGIARDLLLVGDVLYAATDNDVSLLDVTDPADPQEIRRLTSRGRALARAGNRLYVGTFTGSLDIYDIATPAQPALLSSVPLSTYGIQDIDLAGNVLYAAALLSGVLAVDVSDPATPRVVGSFPSAPATATALAGNVLYAARLGAPVAVLDVSDSSAIRQVGTVDQAIGIRKLEVLGDRLFTSGFVLQVFDSTMPTAPVELGAVFPAATFGVSATGVAYASGGAATVAALYAFDFGPEYLPPLEVDIDVKPGDRHNRVLLGRPHPLLVALLGSATLDVRQVDRHALALGPDRAPALISVPALVNRDRKRDLLSLFWTPDTGIAFGDTELCLTGRLRDGRRLRGCDAILTHTGCGRGYELALVVPLCVPLARAARRLRRTRRA